MTKQPKPTLCVLLLNYNGHGILNTCLDSLSKQTQKPDRLLFIDNGSDNFDRKKITEQLGKDFEDRVEFLRIEKNIGYARAMNEGFKLAMSSGLEWIMTLSNDTELASDFFEKFYVLFPLQKSVGMLSPKVRSTQNRNHLDATGIQLSLDGMSTARGQREKDNGQYDRLTDIMMPNGVSGIYSSKLIQEIGIFDETFEAYCEDIDLGLRAWLAGWNCRFIPECVLYHARSATYGEFSLKKLYLVERNHYWVAIKNLPMVLVLLNPIFTLYRYFIQFYAITNGKGQGSGFGGKYKFHELINTTYIALFDALLGAPGAFRKRFFVRKLRKRTYTEMLYAFWKRRMRFHELILK